MLVEPHCHALGRTSLSQCSALPMWVRDLLDPDGSVRQQSGGQVLDC